MLSTLLDWVYPPACISCRILLPLNEMRRFVCERCESLFDPIAPPFCQTCGVPAGTSVKQCASCIGKDFFFNRNHAAFIYEELVRELLHEMKFRNKKRVAQGLGLLWANSSENPMPGEDFTLVPMPMHRKKFRERGFNQAEILTIPLAKKFSRPTANILVRTHDTPPQSGLPPSQRAENVRNIFAIRKGENVCGKNYILTDDIFTTGASLNECAKTLINSGAAKVLCMTLAVSVKKIQIKS